MDQDLDSEISSIRTEIRNLQKHRRILSTSLLNSTALQKRLSSHARSQRGGHTQPNEGKDKDEDKDKEISPLVESAGKHSTTNYHRIGFSATTFPFKDPDPNSRSAGGSGSGSNLLGVRIDVCGRDGRYVQPYYLFLKKVAGSRAGHGREKGKGKEMRVRVHRHTIPGFISLEKLEGVYLPCESGRRRGGDDDDEDGEETMKPWKNRTRRKQDLCGFVREVRRELVAWHLRRDVLGLLREMLGLRDDSENESSGPDDQRRLADSLGIVSLSSTALDARYFRLQWKDGRLGLLRVSNAGVVDRAVVMDDNGRVKRLELAITGNGGRVESVLDRLRNIQS